MLLAVVEVSLNLWLLYALIAGFYFYIIAIMVCIRAYGRAYEGGVRFGRYMAFQEMKETKETKETKEEPPLFFGGVEEPPLVFGGNRHPPKTVKVVGRRQGGG